MPSIPSERKEAHGATLREATQLAEKAVGHGTVSEPMIPEIVRRD
jgi:hypothetical protein